MSSFLKSTYGNNTYGNNSNVMNPKDRTSLTLIQQCITCSGLLVVELCFSDILKQVLITGFTFPSTNYIAGEAQVQGMEASIAK